MSDSDGLGNLKVFTTEEANGLIPQLTLALETLQNLQGAIAKQQATVDAMELITEDESESGCFRINAEIEELNEKVAEYNSMLEAVQAQGCNIKDVEMGIVDFHTLCNERVVYLCWQLGEEKIQYWHEVGDDYEERMPIEEME